jgi:hypothetical protein
VSRAAGGLEYVHVACTQYLTAMHTGGRSAADIDAGGILPGYAGTIVRDGYSGYHHLTDALHAWCGAHNLRDLRDLYTFDPGGQVWARSTGRCAMILACSSSWAWHRAAPAKSFSRLAMPRISHPGQHLQ